MKLTTEYTKEGNPITVHTYGVLEILLDAIIYLPLTYVLICLTGNPQHEEEL